MKRTVAPDGGPRDSAIATTMSPTDRLGIEMWQGGSC